jgi:hypothetical protein
VTLTRELEQRVDELAEEHAGPAFAAAIQAWFEELDPQSQEQLRQILLERASNFDQALMERVDARGWFRRQWERALPVGDDSPPRR